MSRQKEHIPTTTIRWELNGIPGVRTFTGELSKDACIARLRPEFPTIGLQHIESYRVI